MIFSAINTITETRVASTGYYNYSERIIKNATIQIYYTTETISKLTVTPMNWQKAGFH